MYSFVSETLQSIDSVLVGTPILTNGGFEYGKGYTVRRKTGHCCCCCCFSGSSLSEGSVLRTHTHKKKLLGHLLEHLRIHDKVIYQLSVVHERLSLRTNLFFLVYTFVQISLFIIVRLIGGQ